MKTIEDIIDEQRFLLPVVYKNNAPKNMPSDIKNFKVMLTKMLATKNKGWEHEKEVRIVTNKCGRQKFLPSALTGVIFGSNTTEDTKHKILSTFKGRDIDVYHLHKLEGSYDYFIEHLPSLHKTNKLSPSCYEFANAPSKMVDNFYVKPNVPLTSPT